MNAIEGFKIYQVSEYEWYKARNIFEAIKSCIENTGLRFDEACDEELHELSEEEIDYYKYIDTEDGMPEVTFRYRLTYEMKNFPKTPGLFASTEY